MPLTNYDDKFELVRLGKFEQIHQLTILKIAVNISLVIRPSVGVSSIVNSNVPSANSSTSNLIILEPDLNYIL